MSTRATILIKSKKENEEVRIYHHSDGYPAGIGSDILEFNDLVKGKCGMVGCKPDNGYKLTSCQHGDEKYAYLIDCDLKTLTCYEIGWDEFDWKDENIIDIPD